MIISLDDRQKTDLGFLSEVSPELISEFAKFAIESLKKGGNKKVFAGAARQLKVDVETIASAVEGLSFLFSECSKCFLSEADFLETITVLPFSPELSGQLKDLYIESRKEIRNILSDLTINMPQYQNLEWRLDVQIASRSLRNQTEPLFLLKLDLNNPDKTQYLQTDFVNLKNLCNELESALQETKSTHCRRIMRNIK
eukprot:TRINITY_DN1117_c0_g1_i1.p1 TRINITY_DN1117_c0_g1~~TRINITY_DN1117_c0_g1_i1.p1  ORF type:complete len:198 (+),score=36.93 TRINITY_DN1117_c0_g1_i1:33-626(+)